MGIYIAVEGIDGAGKSTQVQRLAERYSAITVAEPGGTPFAQALRQIVKDPSLEMGWEAEALLFASARADLIREVVVPCIAQDLTIISDRSVYSSLAYQGYRKNMDTIGQVWEANRLATLDWKVLPDLVLQIDVDPEDSIARRGGRGADDRMEAVTKSDDLVHGFNAVRTGLRSRLGVARTTWVKVDGSGTPDEVFDEMVWAIDRYVEGGGPRSSMPAVKYTDRDRQAFIDAEQIAIGTGDGLPRGTQRKSHFYRLERGHGYDHWVSLCRKSAPSTITIDRHPRALPTCVRCERYSDSVADLDFTFNRVDVGVGIH